MAKDIDGPEAAPPPDEGVIEDRRALMGLFLSKLRFSGAANLAVGVAVGWLCWVREGDARIWLWLFAFVLLVVARHGIGRRHEGRLAIAGRGELRRMELAQSVLAGLTGALWGALPWIGFQGRDPFMDFFIAANILGMVGGAVTPLSPLAWAFPSYVCAAVLPFAARALLVGGEVYVTAVLTLLFFLAVLSTYNRVVHATMRDAVRLRRENARLVASLRVENEAAEAALRAKSLFLAGVSHDLKHPLQALGLYLGYLKALPAEEAAEAVPLTLPRMEQALGNMGELLARLLDLSRLESGNLRPARRRIAIEELFGHCAAQFSEPARAKGLRLRFVATGAVVEADRAMLQSILDNLVSNAVRYTERGGVVVGARRRAGGIALEVWDTGPGIAREWIPLLFEAYRRFDDTDRDDRGYGLGLALVKKQCDLLGCELSTHSRLGKGTVFRAAMSSPNHTGALAS